MTKRWASLTPDNFRFTAKFPRSITHEKRLSDPERQLRYFFDVMRPLRRKVLALLLQLPPSLTAKEGLKKLEALIHMLDSDFRYAIEVRNKSWFDRSIYKLLSDNNICLAWSQLDAIQTPPELTSDFIYLRFIGDRSIDEKDFGRVQSPIYEKAGQGRPMFEITVGKPIPNNITATGISATPMANCTFTDLFNKGYFLNKACVSSIFNNLEAVSVNANKWRL
jgi:uncharacterized protein YecE (DUF72 family)